MNIFSEAKAAGLNPRYRKLKDDVQLAPAGLFPRLAKGSRVLVTDARNQPQWREKQLVFIEQKGCGCEILVSLTEGLVNK